MSSWQIQVPNRGGEQPLDDAIFDLRAALPDAEDRRITREIFVACRIAGLSTVGQVMEGFEQMTTAELRACLDSVRERVGLKSASDIDADHAFEMRQKEVRRRAAQRPVPTCAVCGVHPTDANGMPDLDVPLVRRWHCSAHLDQAGPTDMLPPPMPVNGLMRVVDPDEVAREQRKDELRAKAEKQRREQREHEAAERAEIEAARAERWKPTGRGWTS
ncbi:MAG: hypothetical protein AABM42_02290 [Actinomycetota bacterium]